MTGSDIITAVFGAANKYTNEGQKARASMFAAMRKLMETEGQMFVCKDYDELEKMALDHTDLVRPIELEGIESNESDVKAADDAMSDLDSAYGTAKDNGYDAGSAAIRSLTQSFAAYRQMIGQSVAR